MTKDKGAETAVAALLAEAARGSADAALLLLTRYRPLIVAETRRFPVDLREDARVLVPPRHAQISAHAREPGALYQSMRTTKAVRQRQSAQGT